MSSDRKKTLLWEQGKENFGLYFQKKSISQRLIQTCTLTPNRLFCFEVFCGVDSVGFVSILSQIKLCSWNFSTKQEFKSFPLPAQLGSALSLLAPSQGDSGSNQPARCRPAVVVPAPHLQAASCHTPAGVSTLVL